MIENSIKLASIMSFNMHSNLSFANEPDSNNRFLMTDSLYLIECLNITELFT
jgi:hypothetical protein